MTTLKRQRNTTELPIGVAIDKLSILASERAEVLADAMATAADRVNKSFDERAERILFRVPDEFRGHVAEKAGYKIEPPSSKPGLTEDEKAFLDGRAEDPLPGAAEDAAPDLPQGARPLSPEREQRLAKLGAGR